MICTAQYALCSAYHNTITCRCQYTHDKFLCDGLTTTKIRIPRFFSKQRIRCPIVIIANAFDLQFPIDRLFLSANEVRINTGLGNQLLMFALLHDAAVINHKDLIGVSNRF